MCRERGKLSGGRFSVVLRDGRNLAVGDRVFCAERGLNLNGGP